jgi:hypothetical protein
MVNRPSLLAALKARNMRLQTRIVDLEEKLISAQNRIKALEAERKGALEAGGPKALRVNFGSKIVAPLKLATRKARHRG